VNAFADVHSKTVVIVIVIEDFMAGEKIRKQYDRNRES